MSDSLTPNLSLHRLDTDVDNLAPRLRANMDIIDGLFVSGGSNAITYKGNGAPSGTEFSYLSGVTSAIQTQLNSKVPTSRSINSHALTSDVTLTTDDIAEGSTNKYYTDARFDTRLATKSTTNLAEGTNLYYTDVRADARITAQKGAANGLATLGSDSKIPTSQLPALAITDTFVVASQSAMLAVTAQTGDVAVRTDLHKSYILQGSDPTVLANWQELLTPIDSVLSVNGQTGAVVLTTSNITEGSNLYYTDARARAAIGGTAHQINYNSTTGALSTPQDIDIVSSPTFAGLNANGASFNLVNATTTTVNFAGAATALSIGAATGTATLNNAAVTLAGSLLGVSTAYNTDIGQFTKKFKSLYAAELSVQTLVAQDTQATFGGSLLVGPTTQLVSDVSTSDTTIHVKHNQLSNGDRVRLEANGKFEYMAITSNPSGSAGNYSYTVTRNLQFTGAQSWSAGDAVFNTGQAGSGYWDIFSLHSTVTVVPDYAYNSGLANNYNQTATWSPFGDGSNALGGAVYFGVVGTNWQNLYFNLTTAAAYSATLVWEYWNGSAWTSFVPTFVGNTNGDFKQTGWQGFEWTASSLTGWTTTTVFSLSAYWVRVRVSAFTSWTTLPQTNRRVYRNKGQIGPTQVLWKRNSSAFNDVTENAAFGELVGYYGYTASTMGVALGEYAAGKTHVTLDSTNGLRFFNGLSTVVQQIDISGNTTIGDPGTNNGNVKITAAGQIQIRRGTTNYITLDATDAQFTNLIKMSGSSAAISIGSTPPTDATHGTGIWIDRNAITGLLANVVQAKFDAATGAITAGAGNVTVDSSGIGVTGATSKASTNSYKLFGTNGSTLYSSLYDLIATNTHTTILEVEDVKTANAFLLKTTSYSGSATITLQTNRSGSSQEQIILGAQTGITLYSSIGVAIGTTSTVPQTPGAMLDVFLTDAGTNALADVQIIRHNSSGTPATNFGGSLLFNLQSSTTADQNAARIGAIWTTATHASRTSAIVFQTVNNAGGLTEAGRFTGDGHLTLANPLAVAQGGTGSTTASGARSALGAANIAGDTFTGNVTIANGSVNSALRVNGLSTGAAYFFNSQSGAGQDRATLSVNGYYNGTSWSYVDNTLVTWALQMRTNEDDFVINRGAANSPPSSTLFKIFGTGGGNFGSPTGGDKGAGTFNFAGDIYKNGASYTNPDYVLEHWATGRIERFKDNEGASGYTGLMPIADLERFVKTNYHLPRFGQQANHGVFSGGDASLATIEEYALYIIELEKRIAILEAR